MILRGNSASGKSTIARAVRERLSGHRVAVVHQDVVRREILGERDRPEAANIGMIDLITRYALDEGFHVVLEGILYAPHYGAMLTSLAADHRGLTRCYYLDVPFEETLIRHATKPPTSEYGEAEMRGWYHADDRLESLCEVVIPAANSLEGSVELIIRDCRLAEVGQDSRAD